MRPDNYGKATAGSNAGQQQLGVKFAYLVFNRYDQPCFAFIYFPVFIELLIPSFHLEPFALCHLVKGYDLVGRYDVFDILFATISLCPSDRQSKEYITELVNFDASRIVEYVLKAFNFIIQCIESYTRITVLLKFGSIVRAR